MKYIGIVYETVNSGCECKFDRFGYGYFSTDRELYKINNNILQCVYFGDDGFSYCFSRRGVWISVGNDVDCQCSKFIDIYNQNIEMHSISERVQVECDDLLIATGLFVNQDYLYCFDMHKGVSIRRDNMDGYVSCISSKIYINRYMPPYGLFCLDKELNDIWSFINEEPSASKASQSSFFHEDLVIINYSKDILAFNKNNGEQVWKYSLARQSPGSIYVANNKVYLTEVTEMVILDASTGQEIGREPTGYCDRTDSFGTNSNDVSMYPIGDDMVFTYATYEPEIKFFSSDLKNCLQILDIFENTNYGVYGDRPAEIHGNEAFIRVGSGATFSNGGVLYLRPAKEGEQLEIRHMPRLPISYYAVPNLQSEHKYEVYVEGDSLDHVRRYAGLAIKELHFETGNIPMYTEKTGALDYKHNGQIELIVDPAPFPDTADSELQSLLTELKEYFDSHSAGTSNGKHSIELSLKLKPKSEWLQEGEMLDLDKARKIGKPLNKK